MQLGPPMVPGGKLYSLLHIMAASQVATEGDGTHGHEEDDDHVVVHQRLLRSVQCHHYVTAKALSPRGEWAQMVGSTVPSFTQDLPRTLRIQP